MFLVGHAAVGITITQALGVTNPVAAFGVGWLSHYLADFVPHGDEGLGEWVKKGHEVRRLAAVTAIDGTIALAAFALFASRQQEFPMAAAAAAVGSWVPDVMWGLEKLLQRRLFGPHERLHHWNHNRLHIMLPLKVGITLQAIVTAALWNGLVRG